MHVLGNMVRFLLSSHHSRGLPCQKSNGSNVLRSFLVYQVLLRSLCVQFVCSTGSSYSSVQCRAPTLTLGKTVCQWLLHVVNEAVYHLGENSFGLLIFAGSQSRVANKTFAKGRTQCALPVMLMLSCSHTENIFLSLHCCSATLPLPL